LLEQFGGIRLLPILAVLDMLEYWYWYRKW